MLSLRVWCIAISLAFKMFCNPGNHRDIHKFLVELYMPYDVVLVTQLSSLIFIGGKMTHLCSNYEVLGIWTVDVYQITGLEGPNYNLSVMFVFWVLGSIYDFCWVWCVWRCWKYFVCVKLLC